MTILPFDQQPRSTTQEISNLLDVSARTLSETPKAFYDELSNDLSKHLPQVVARVGEGAVIGAGTTLLLKMPRVAPIAMAAGLAYTGYKALTAAGDFVGQATNADTDAERKLVAQSSAHQLGGTMSAMLEGAPGLVAGGYGVSRAFGAPPLYTRIGDAVENKVLAPVRETYAFRGPGSVKLSGTLVNQNGEFDALNASKMLAQRHPWEGVETGSTIDLSKMRMSRLVNGDAEGIGTLPGSARSDVVPFHIHGPKAPAGFLPSNVDVAATPGLGILKQGDVTTFYVGQARDYAAMVKAGNAEYFAPSMKAVVVDSRTGLAQRFTGQWIPGQGAKLDKPVNLDFGQLLEALGKVKTVNPWESLSSVPAKTGI